MQQHPVPGHALVTRRAVAELVERAAAGSYGVIGFGSRNVVARVLGRLGLGTPGVRVRIVPSLDVELFVIVAFGVPIAEVAHNVESAVRYAVRQSLGRELDSISIHVRGLRVLQPRRDEPGAPRT